VGILSGPAAIAAPSSCGAISPSGSRGLVGEPLLDLGDHAHCQFRDAVKDLGRAGELDRLSRSLVYFAGLMERAQSRKWNLVALDLGVDLSTPAGEFLASVLASAAQGERRIIGQRTKDALAQKKAKGVRLGRRPVLDPAV
jgi:hypothetical protein